MKKKDEEAFLKSIFGTAPIKKKDNIKKTPPINQKTTTKIILKKIIEIPPLQEHNLHKKESFFRIEKTSINKKLKKGRIPIDKKIDFHGLSVLEAENLFSETVKNCYNKKLRCLLFVTGKGVLKKSREQNEKTQLYYGKIRNNFNLWANKEILRKYILGLEHAGIEHGADGAFFVYLRKNKN